MTTGITGLGNIPEPSAPRGSRERNRASLSDPAQSQDEVTFSAAAREAATKDKVIHESEEHSEIRQEVIDQAKANIEAGAHKVQGVVELVAARLVSII